MAEHSTPRAVGPEFSETAGTFLKRVSWGAIFAGAVIALVLEICLILLGMGIGFANINPVTEQHPFAGFGTRSGIWMGISFLISLFAGGYVTARLAGSLQTVNGILHGLVVWGIVSLASVYLMTTAAGSLLGGAFTVAGKGISMLGTGTAAVTPQAARNVSQDVMSGLSKAAMWAFIAMVLEAIAAGIGGALGARTEYRHAHYGTRA
jgi:hypothetical protein